MGLKDEHPEGTRAFESDFMERLSRIHPAFPAIFWGPVALAAILWGIWSGVHWAAALGLTLGGLFVWTFFEYVLHRWIFHFVPENEGLKKWYYLVHQIHHDYQEWDRLVAPPLLSGALCAIFLGLFWLIFGSPMMWPFFGGFTIGYLAYDYVHFYTHFAKPKTAIGKGLRRRHLQHHHAYPDRWYGVSSPLWDYVFRTHVRPGEARAPRPKGEGPVWPRRELNV